MGQCCGRPSPPPPVPPPSHEKSRVRRIVSAPTVSLSLEEIGQPIVSPGRRKSGSGRTSSGGLSPKSTTLGDERDERGMIDDPLVSHMSASSRSHSQHSNLEVPERSRRTSRHTSRGSSTHGTMNLQDTKRLSNPGTMSLLEAIQANRELSASPSLRRKRRSKSADRFQAVRSSSAAPMSLKTTSESAASGDEGHGRIRSSSVGTSEGRSAKSLISSPGRGNNLFAALPAAPQDPDAPGVRPLSSISDGVILDEPMDLSTPRLAKGRSSKRRRRKVVDRGYGDAMDGSEYAAVTVSTPRGNVSAIPAAIYDDLPSELAMALAEQETLLAERVAAMEYADAELIRQEALARLEREYEASKVDEQAKGAAGGHYLRVLRSLNRVMEELDDDELFGTIRGGNMGSLGSIASSPRTPNRRRASADSSQTRRLSTDSSLARRISDDEMSLRRRRVPESSDSRVSGDDDGRRRFSPQGSRTGSRSARPPVQDDPGESAQRRRTLSKGVPDVPLYSLPSAVKRKTNDDLRE